MFALIYLRADIILLFHTFTHVGTYHVCGFCNTTCVVVVAQLAQVGVCHSSQCSTQLVCGILIHYLVPVVLSLLCATHCPLSSVLLHLTSFFTRPGKHYCCIALVCCWCCDSCSTHGTFCFELLLCHCCCLHVNLVSVVQFFF